MRPEREARGYPPGTPDLGTGEGCACRRVRVWRTRHDGLREPHGEPLPNGSANRCANEPATPRDAAERP